jgi:cell wall-associated NlpC family hydrolase
LPIDTQTAGYAQAVARVQEIIAPLQPAPPATSVTPAGNFAGQLSSAMKPSAAGSAPTTAAGYTSEAARVDPAALNGAGGRGAQIAALATSELGVAEQPPGSNDGPRIAQYRTATAGSGVGPWCAYFTSWVANQAGVPLGPNGQGIGYVPTVKQWAEQTGRYIPGGSAPPQVGDLVVFERNGDGVLDHIGVVTGTRPDGGIETVEGNSSDKVSARSYGPGGYAGLVRLVAPGT